MKTLRIGQRLCRYYISITIFVSLMFFTMPTVFATNTGTMNIWDLANKIIVDVYTGIAGISTALAGMMTAVAVIGAKMSNNQHKTDQAWDWMRRIWIAWAIINSVGALIAYVIPMFEGFNTLTPTLPR